LDREKAERRRPSKGKRTTCGHEWQRSSQKYRVTAAATTAAAAAIAPPAFLFLALSGVKCSFSADRVRTAEVDPPSAARQRGTKRRLSAATTVDQPGWEAAQILRIGEHKDVRGWGRPHWQSRPAYWAAILHHAIAV